MVEFGGAGVWVKYFLVDIRPSSQFSFFYQKNHFEGVHICLKFRGVTHTIEL